MSRFYVTPDNIKDDSIFIDGQEARHILKAMRLTEGDKVVIFDGTGKEYTGFIRKTNPASLQVEVISTKMPKKEALPLVTLAQCVPKKEKMDYIVEKATELGVYSIIPLLSERTIVKPAEKSASNKITRWKKIAREAAKQCGRIDVPQITEIKKFYNVIDKIDSFDLALMACLSEETIGIKESINDFESGKIIIFIGPEGDFTSEEITMAKETSCKLISLGRRILKSDTAGLYVLSIMNYELSR